MRALPGRRRGAQANGPVIVSGAVAVGLANPEVAPRCCLAVRSGRRPVVLLRTELGTAITLSALGQNWSTCAG